MVFDDEAICSDNGEDDDEDSQSDLSDFIDNEENESGDTKFTELIDTDSETEFLLTSKKRTSTKRKETKQNPVLKPKTRGRPPKIQKTVEEKLPGDLTFPETDFSLTITKTGEDVSLELLDILYEFLLQYCVKGGVSFEVGARAFNLHIQGLFRIHYPKTKEFVKKLQSFIKKLLPQKGKGYKVNLKPLAGGQSFSAMIGYITKDVGQAHYQIRSHNITPEVKFIT